MGETMDAQALYNPAITLGLGCLPCQACAARAAVNKAWSVWSLLVRDAGPNWILVHNSTIRCGDTSIPIKELTKSTGADSCLVYICGER